jgi:hypothetical protein
MKYQQELIDQEAEYKANARKIKEKHLKELDLLK